MEKIRKEDSQPVWKNGDLNFGFVDSKLHFIFSEVVGNNGTFLVGKKYYFNPDITFSRKQITSLSVVTENVFAGAGTIYTVPDFQAIPQVYLRNFFINLVDKDNNYILKNCPIALFNYQPFVGRKQKLRKMLINYIALEKSYIINSGTTLPLTFQKNLAIPFNFYSRFAEDV